MQHVILCQMENRVFFYSEIQNLGTPLTLTGQKS